MAVGTARLAAALSLVAALALAVAGCLGNDDDSDSDSVGVEQALAVEAITDDAGTAAERSLVRLNRVANGELEPSRAAQMLGDDARAIDRAASELEELELQAPTPTTADDLGFVLDDLGLDLLRTQTDLRLIGRGELSREVLNGDRRLVLARITALGALSRALRTILTEAGA